MASPLVGAWELVSDTEEGVLVFSDSHYSMVWQEKNRKPYPVDSPTDADELEAYRTHQSQAGTYQVSGSKMTVGREISRHPGRSGNPSEIELTIEGNTINMRNPGSSELIWKRSARRRLL